MELNKQFERDGNWLFRWSSYLPLLMIALFILAFRELKYSDYSYSLDRSWELLCLAVALFGLGIRVLTVGYVPGGTSGRNTVRQKAETLNTTGMYSIVRHPLYLGNFIMWLGVSMFARLWWFSLIFTMIFWLYYERIMFAEEMFLKNRFGDTFVKWAETTPCFIPNFKRWESFPPFSFETLTPENHTLVRNRNLYSVYSIWFDLNTSIQYKGVNSLSIHYRHANNSSYPLPPTKLRLSL